jgi:hypothetical protein
LHQYATEYRLGNKGGKRWPHLDAGGAYLGDGKPLLKRIPSGLGHKWIVRPEAELERLFGESYGKPRVDARGWARNLQAVANALNKGDMSLAAITLVLARIPALPARVEKYDPSEPRAPAGQSDGGEWTTDDASVGNASDGALGDASAPDDLEAGFSLPALELFRRIRDAINDGRLSPELIANIVAEFAANIPPREIPNDVIAAFEAPRDLAQLQSAKPPAAFPSASALSAYLGSAPPGYEWHHIVEQSVIAEHPDDPWIAHEINSTENVVLIPKIYHLLITADMNTGTTRAVVHGHDFIAQRKIGLDPMRKCGALE